MIIQMKEKMHKFEKKYSNLDSSMFTIGEVNVLPLIRREIKFNYLSEKKEKIVTNHGRIRMHELFKVFVFFFKSVGQILTIFKYKNKRFLFLGFSRRSKLLNGNYLDKFHDPIIDCLDVNDCIMIEKPFKQQHERDRSTSAPIIDYDFFTYTSLAIATLITPIIFCVFLRKFKLMRQLLEKEFRRSFKGNYWLSHVFSKFLVDAFFARIVVQIIRPEILIVTSRWLHYPFIYVCKNKGVHIVELQHGCVMKTNFFYDDFNETPFQIDTMAVFSDQWKDRYWNAKQVVVFGLKQTYLDKSNNAEDDNLELPKSVLVISQPEMCSKLSEDLEHLAASNSRVDFHVKLHPQDIDNYHVRYKRLTNLNNVSFISGFEADTRELVRNYALVLGYTSTVLFEALDVGCSVGLISSDEVGIEEYQSYYGSMVDYFNIVDRDGILYFDLLVNQKISARIFSNLNEIAINRFFYEAYI